MKIQKLLHSCLLVEEKGTTILFDPGTWSFGAGYLDVKALPKIDAVFITHKHADHCDPTTLKFLVARDSCPIYCNEDIGAHLLEAGVATTTITIPQAITIGSISVTSVPADHGALPWGSCINNGFFINQKIFTPGDSHSFEKNIGTAPEILALPVAAPWGTSTEAVALALRLKPKHIIPIHDMIVTPDFRDRLNMNIGSVLGKAGIEFHALKPGEILAVNE